jgi:hypothetical protein
MADIQVPNWFNGNAEQFAEWAAKNAFSAKAASPLLADSSALAEEIQKTYASQLGVNAAISGAASALQLGMAVAPTAQDRRNKQKRAALEKMEKDGKMGQLTADEEAALGAQAATAGAVAASGALRAESANASMGNASAADALRPQREAQAEAQDAIGRVGMQRTAAMINKARERTEELEGRVAYGSERQKRILSNISNTIGQAAGIGGQVAAAQAVKGINIDDMIQKYPNMSLDDIVMLMGMSRRGQLEGENGASVQSMARGN